MGNHALFTQILITTHRQSKLLKLKIFKTYRLNLYLFCYAFLHLAYFQHHSSVDQHSYILLVDLKLPQKILQTKLICKTYFDLSQLKVFGEMITKNELFGPHVAMITTLSNCGGKQNSCRFIFRIKSLGLINVEISISNYQPLGISSRNC